MQFPGKHTQSGFLDLICDAIFHLRLAQSNPDEYIQNRHSRASIISSALSVESCANCLLRTIKSSAGFEEDIEQLRTLSKFELHLKMGGLGSAVDRGDMRVSKIADLIRLRNDFVHPKTMKTSVELGLLVEAQEQVRWPIEMTPSVLPNLGIPKHGPFWRAPHAKSVFSAIVDFFQYYFAELSKMKGEQVKGLFSPVTTVTMGHQEVIIESYTQEFNDEFAWAESEGFALAFLGWR